MKLFIAGEVVVLCLKKGKRRKRKKNEFQSDLYPDPLGCSLAAVPLYHDVSPTVEGNSLTNYSEIRNIFVTGTKMDVIPDIFQPQLLMSDLNTG